MQNLINYINKQYIQIINNYCLHLKYAANSEDVLEYLYIINL